MRDPIPEFMTYNRAFAQRNPELLRLKVARMAESPFAFFRGTFHLFARDVLGRIFESVPLFTSAGPELALVGDIHSENYGTYTATDGALHYDINDFDETTHGRLDFDLCRQATSLFLAARDSGYGIADAVHVTLVGLTTYLDMVRRVLKKGKGLEFDVNEETATAYPPVANLLRTYGAVKRPEFIAKLTELHDGQRRLVRTLRYFNLADEERQQALRLLEDYLKRRKELRAKEPKDYFKVQDICGRVSGIGSMGRFRYVVMVNGKGTRDARNVLLEFKESRPSAYDVYRNRETDAAALVRRAEEVSAAQREAQVASNQYLGFAVDGAMSFQVRELGPHDGRVDLKAQTQLPRMESVAQMQAGLLARTHARAAGRCVGPTNPLAELSDVDSFAQRVLAFALAYADLAHRDWARFVGHCDELEDCEKWSAAVSPP
jgi:uncharacterized protein (DUF2252 family)